MILASVLAGVDDRRLMARVANGDERALRLLYDRYGGKVLSAARRILGSVGEAEETVQDTFIDVWNRAGSFDGDKGTPASWILTIGRNRAIDRLRTRASQARAVDELRHEAPAPPVDHAAENDERRRISQALQRLPPEQRAVVELAYFDGLSQSEIAERTGHPLGTIKGRARAALEKLAQHLAEEVA